MQVLESEVVEIIRENLKLNKLMPIYFLIGDAKSYVHYDCDNNKIIYFVYDEGFGFAIKRLLDTENNKNLKRVVLEAIPNVRDVKIISRSDFKQIPECINITKKELSTKTNTIILDIINKNDRLREQVKNIINEKCKVINEELNELKYNYYDITKSNDENKIETHRLKIVEKENEIENYMIALEELNSII